MKFSSDFALSGSVCLKKHQNIVSGWMDA